jgi:DNA-binding PadR family transcriptional regulator
MTSTRPLGSIQRHVLTSLEREPWPGGWIWENASTTARVLDSLVKRGLASHTDGGPYRRGRYRITEAGKEALTA